MPAIVELFQLAVDHHQKGDLAQAEFLYRQILRADSSFVDAYPNLGILLEASGRGQEALACFEEVVRLKPEQADGYNNLGNALVAQGQLAQASACFQQAISINPNHMEARNNLGLAFVVQGRLAEATICFREVLAIDPNRASAHINLGNALLLQNQPAKAAQCFYQAIRLNPNDASAHNNMGKALDLLGHTAEAIEYFRRAIFIDSNHANAHNNLGNALVTQGELAHAAECYKQAVRICPENPDLMGNLGSAYKDLGRFADATDCFRRALAINPEHKVTLANLSRLHLLQGDFKKGWPDFEQRCALPGANQPTFAQPRWDGSSLEGKTLFVYSEGGLGDTIQFMRYLPLAKQRGGLVCFGCQAPLFKLLQYNSGADQVIATGMPLPSFDVQIALLSLPGIFGTSLDTIPTVIPYLKADPALTNDWRKTLDRENGFKIGIVWQGSNTKKEERRFFPLTHFAGLALMEGVRLISLQVGPAAQQLAAVPFPVFDLGSMFDPNSLDDAAAALVNLDLVVTVDTATAHLAGALGVPVWVALPFVPDWRWLLNRPDSPWYPTMRLFRQSKPGDWETVFVSLAEVLGRLMAARKNEEAGVAQ